MQTQVRNKKGMFIVGHPILFKGNPLFVKCPCGKEFRTYPCKISVGRGKYCSKECCLKETNKILEANGKETRFEHGRETWNKQGFTYTQARKDGQKYRLIYIPEHPNASLKGYLREHRLVMEKKIGRYLRDDEVVHHIDENTLNNDITNLTIFTVKEHCRLHADNLHKR